MKMEKPKSALTLRTFGQDLSRCASGMVFQSLSETGWHHGGLVPWRRQPKRSCEALIYFLVPFTHVVAIKSQGRNSCYATAVLASCKCLKTLMAFLFFHNITELDGNILFRTQSYTVLSMHRTSFLFLGLFADVSFR